MMFCIEFRHVDATDEELSPNRPEDVIVEWVSIEADTEEKAFESNARRFHALCPHRGIISQRIVP